MRRKHLLLFATLIVLIGALAPPHSDARESCADRIARATSLFARGLESVARRCTRRSTACPDPRTRLAMARLRDRIADSILRKCPLNDVTALLDPIQIDVACKVLGRCAVPNGAMDVRFLPLSREGPLAAGISDVDAGWTGEAHDLVTLGGGGWRADLMNCGENDTLCNLDGATAGDFLAAPFPVAAGGVATCVTLRFAADVSGTFDTATGDLTAAAPLRIEIFSGPTLDQPCPVCVPLSTDTAPRIGNPGVCRGGSRGGLACRIGGLNDPAFGTASLTSADCPPPANARITAFEFDVAATTGQATFAAAQPCTGPGFASERCWCFGQLRPNGCDDGVCSASGVCEAGPFEGFCSNLPFVSCRLGGTTDCEDVFPGAGTCEVRPRPCFADPITRVGTADPPLDNLAVPTLAGTFCFPATNTPAVNTVTGFPGPGAFLLPAVVTITPGDGMP